MILPTAGTAAAVPASDSSTPWDMAATHRGDDRRGASGHPWYRPERQSRYADQAAARVQPAAHAWLVFGTGKQADHDSLGDPASLRSSGCKDGEVIRDCRLASFLCRKRYGPEASSSITGVRALLLALNCRASRADEARKVQLSAAEAVFVLAIQSRRA